MDTLNRPLISIIIPVYNVEKYLRPSLDSIIVQDISDCEILLINDGSKDNSLSILQEYMELYPNIRVINKDNEGVSATRNRGLDECLGEYFYFMDSDDRLHPQLLSLIRKEIYSFQPDIIVWDFNTFYSKPKYIKVPTSLSAENVPNNNKEGFNYLMMKGSAVSLWNKAIRRSLIGKKVRIDTTMSYGEDMFFCWKAIMLAEKIRYIHLPLYYYIQTGNGATNRFHNDLYEHYRKAFEDMYHFVKKQGMASESVLSSIDYHFACRIPSLSNMETRAPYGRERKISHLNTVLKDDYIQRGLFGTPQPTGLIFTYARNNNVAAMLRYARWESLKLKLVFPIKKILK